MILSQKITTNLINKKGAHCWLSNIANQHLCICSAVRSSQSAVFVMPLRLSAITDEGADIVLLDRPHHKRSLKKQQDELNIHLKYCMLYISVEFLNWLSIIVNISIFLVFWAPQLKGLYLWEKKMAGLIRMKCQTKLFFWIIIITFVTCKEWNFFCLVLT